jgi:hypothetical protein
MSVGRTKETLNITVGGKPVTQCKEFKYLGSIFAEDDRMDREIEARTQSANAVLHQISPLLQHANIPMTTKARLINSTFIPSLTYQCQTWTLNKAQKQKITTTEMKCLRRAAGKTIRDKIRNEEIRKVVGATPVNDFINQQRIRWFGHLVRMPVTQPALRAYNTRCTGSRPRGRPRKRWINEVADHLHENNTTIAQAMHQALARQPLLPATPIR